MSSWLGSLWGGSSSSSLPYNIEPTAAISSQAFGQHGWAVHNATKKTDGSEATAFQANKAELAKTPARRPASIADARYTSSSGLTQLIPALHHYHRIKRLIHPRILRAHATIDTDYPDESKPSPGLDNLEKSAATGTLIIVTEKSTPLNDWLENLNPHTSQANAAAISWGVYNIVEALTFLHTQAKLAHGMLCPEAVFVTPSGDFKLGGFDLITPVGSDGAQTGPTPHFRQYEGAVCPAEFRSPERVGGRYDLLQSGSPIHAMDCYSLAVLIEYVYTHPNSGTSGVPTPLKKALLRMKNDSPKLRPRLAPLLKCPVFDNPYVKAELFLDEVMSKPVEEKIMFLQSLPDVLNRGVLTENVAIHKILPLLVMGLQSTAKNEQAMAQDVNRRETLATIPLLFQIAESYLANSPELFARHVTPLVPTLFAINDRGVRGAILQKISLLESQMDKSSINASVFEPMCSGFTDSSGPLRELTLKSTVVLVPKLNPTNLEKLTRYLVRMQADPEASIRTNTVIFIGKIAPNLTEMSRQKLILPAFTRAMKDPFTPCRLSALRAVISCKEYFSQRDVADKVLPSVVPYTLDAANDVRSEAFGVVDALLVGLREESQKMSKEEQDRISAATCGLGNESIGGGASNGGAAASASGSGYLSGLSSWMTAETDLPPPPASSSVSGSSAVGGVSQQEPVRPAVSAGTSSGSSAAPKFSSLSLSDAQIGGGGSSSAAADGWDDDDDILGGGSSSAAAGGDDDFFASFNSKPARPAAAGGSSLGGVRKSSTAKPAPRMQSGMKLKKQAKPAVKKLPPSSLLDDGWDDF
mmetsp:Transcript_36872/g.84166  ORF Transcript_36872/g.84166 Transcript_36872/m.84166 type:complete len:812 (+) Transcript_36872:184-2619(+)